MQARGNRRAVFLLFLLLFGGLLTLKGIGRSIVPAAGLPESPSAPLTTEVSGAEEAQAVSSPAPAREAADSAPAPSPGPAPTPAPAPLPKPFPEPEPEVRLAFVGDILLGGGLAGTLAHHGPDHPWAQVAPILRGADLALGNLETAVTRGGQPAPDKQWTFRSDPDTIPGVARSGIDVLSLANNHSLDFGQEALLETLGRLREAGIHPVGAGANETEAWRPLILEVKGLKLAIFGFTRVIPVPEWAAGAERPGLASGYDPQPVLNALDEVRDQVDAVIVLFHWGEERQDHPREIDTGLAEEMIAHGATLVVGHHPHVLQGMALQNGRLTAYSLGNFVFTSVERRLNQQTGILEVTLSRQGVTDARLTPFYITNGQPGPVAPEERTAMLERLDQLSHPWGTTVDREGRIRPIQK